MTEDKREDWLEAAKVIFRLVYGKDASTGGPQDTEDGPDNERVTP